MGGLFRRSGASADMGVDGIGTAYAVPGDLQLAMNVGSMSPCVFEFSQARMFCRLTTIDDGPLRPIPSIASVLSSVFVFNK